MGRPCAELWSHSSVRDHVNCTFKGFATLDAWVDLEAALLSPPRERGVGMLIVPDGGAIVGTYAMNAVASCATAEATHEWLVDQHVEWLACTGMSYHMMMQPSWSHYDPHSRSTHQSTGHVCLFGPAEHIKSGCNLLVQAVWRLLAQARLHRRQCSPRSLVVDLLPQQADIVRAASDRHMVQCSMSSQSSSSLSWGGRCMFMLTASSTMGVRRCPCPANPCSSITLPVWQGAPGWQGLYC